MDSLRRELEEIFKSDCLIMCLGNLDRSDDGIGIYIGQSLGEKVILAMNTPVNFLGNIVRRNPEVLVLIDAIDGQLDPGDITVSDSRIILDSGSLTTHYQEFSNLQQFLQESGVDPIIRVIGIQVEDTTLYGKMTDEVKHAGDVVISLLKQMI